VPGGSARPRRRPRKRTLFRPGRPRTRNFPTKRQRGESSSTWKTTSAGAESVKEILMLRWGLGPWVASQSRDVRMRLTSVARLLDRRSRGASADVRLGVRAPSRGKLSAPEGRVLLERVLSSLSPGAGGGVDPRGGGGDEAGPGAGTGGGAGAGGTGAGGVGSGGAVCGFGFSFGGLGRGFGGLRPGCSVGGAGWDGLSTGGTVTGGR